MMQFSPSGWNQSFIVLYLFYDPFYYTVYCCLLTYFRDVSVLFLVFSTGQIVSIVHLKAKVRRKLSSSLLHFPKDLLKS